MGYWQSSEVWRHISTFEDSHTSMALVSHAWSWLISSANAFPFAPWASHFRLCADFEAFHLEVVASLNWLNTRWAFLEPSFWADLLVSANCLKWTFFLSSLPLRWEAIASLGCLAPTCGHPDACAVSSSAVATLLHGLNHQSIALVNFQMWPRLQRIALSLVVSFESEETLIDGEQQLFLSPATSFSFLAKEANFILAVVSHIQALLASFYSLE